MTVSFYIFLRTMPSMTVIYNRENGKCIHRIILRANEIFIESFAKTVQTSHKKEGVTCVLYA